MKHGGKRKGSGRPKLTKSQKKEPTKVMRVPISKVTNVLNIISENELDENEILDCPNCGRSYDDADADFYICHHCGFHA